MLKIQGLDISENNQFDDKNNRGFSLRRSGAVPNEN